MTTSMYSSGMRTARQLTVLGGLPIEEGLLLEGWGSGFGRRGLPAPWHCGKVDLRL